MMGQISTSKPHCAANYCVQLVGINEIFMVLAVKGCFKRLPDTI
jgi:hypothetical protein